MVREKGSIRRFMRRSSAAISLLALVLAAVSCRTEEPLPLAAPLPAPVRAYAFEQYGPTASNVADRAGSPAALVFQPVRTKEHPPEAARAVEGRAAGRTAARLDRATLTAPAFISSNGYTVALWARVNAQGGLLGNDGYSNGTLVAVGNGYSDGWRVTADMARRTLSFSIGRPQPPHAVSVTADLGPGAPWRHLAASWDGREMRLFVDGVPVARRAFTEPYTPPPQNTLRLGYANAGVGSVVLDVDEFAAYERALSPSEVLRLAASDAPTPAPAAEAVDRAVSNLDATHATGAAAVLDAALSAGECLDPRLEIALLGLKAEICRQAGDPAGTAVALDAMLASPALSGDRREETQTRLLELLRGTCTLFSPPILERMLSSSGLTSADRLRVLLALGQSETAAGRADRARAHFERILAEPGAPALYPAIARLAIARLDLEGGDTAAARRALEAVSTLPGVADAYLDEARSVLERLRAGEEGKAGQLARLPPLPAPGHVFHVAPGGDDSNAGTREKPFATLERARDTARALRESGRWPDGGVAIRIAGGRYPVTRTFALSGGDSGSAGAPLVFVAEDPADPPRFDGGVRLGEFSPVSDSAVRERLPAESRDSVVEADLRSAGITNLPTLILGGFSSGHGFRTRPVQELFFDGEAMPLSRWPNEGFEKLAGVHGPTPKDAHGMKGCAEGVVSYDGDRPARWTRETDGFLYGYWFWTWADSYERIESIDPAARRIALAKPWHHYGFRKGASWCAVNLIAEIDRPGEWCIDRAALKLYFLPPSDPAGAEVVLSRFEEPMLRAENLEHVVFSGLVWEHGAADAVEIRNGTNVVFSGCTVRHFAGDGLRVDGGTSNTVRSCDVYSMGRGGMAVSGGDRKTLRVGGHRVENCHIHHLSRLHHTYTPAVILSGVGHRIAHCLVHDVASSAFRVGGNDHLVELSEVCDVVTESDDQGGIDMWGNATFRGNVFRHNYWHHIGNWRREAADLPVGRAGIRLDDAISGVTIRGNIFHRCGGGMHGFGGVQIHGGKGNAVDGNLFSHCGAAVSFSPWEQSRWEEFVKDAMRSDEIDPRLYLERYPALTNLATDANVNDLWRNWVWRCDEFTRRGRAGSIQMAGNVVENGTAEAFVDAEHGDFRLKPGARLPACLGPETIPFERIGLQADEFRRTLPQAFLRAARARAP